MKTNFNNESEAFQYMYDTVDDSCIDNTRFAWVDDPKALKEYHEQASQGCCGSYDTEVSINGRRAMIGCNYGH